jgi:hypothetical protein
MLQNVCLGTTVRNLSEVHYEIRKRANSFQNLFVFPSTFQDIKVQGTYVK